LKAGRATPTTRRQVVGLLGHVLFEQRVDKIRDFGFGKPQVLSQLKSRRVVHPEHGLEQPQLIIGLNRSAGKHVYLD
jgi:hypothetical protein